MGDFGKVRPADNITLDVTGMGDIVSEVLMALGARVILQPRFLDDIGFGEPVF